MRKILACGKNCIAADRFESDNIGLARLIQSFFLHRGISESSLTNPKLLDQVRNLIGTRNLSYSTEKSYVYHVRDFILCHGKRHPAKMGVTEIRGYLPHLAVDRKVAAYRHSRRPLGQSIQPVDRLIQPVPSH